MRQKPLTRAEINATVERAIAGPPNEVETKKLTAAEMDATVEKAVKIPAAIKRVTVKWPEQTAKGGPQKHSMINARMAIQQLKLDCSLDTFHGSYLINGTSLQGFVGELSDKDAENP